MSPYLRSLAVAALLLAAPGAAAAQTCARTLTADVVAFDQVWFWNRLGAVQPQGMMFALRRDVVPISGTTLSPGNVKLRADKRPRPIVLRMNVGDCLRISFQNLLSPTRVDDNQSATRWASIHAVGMQLVGSILDDGSYVGQNANSQVNVGQSAIYNLYAEREGQHVLQSLGAVAGGEGDGGHVNSAISTPAATTGPTSAATAPRPCPRANKGPMSGMPATSGSTSTARSPRRPSSSAPPT